MHYKDITAIITSFKSENKILNCLNSLGKDIKIIVIENSNDKNLKRKLEKEFPNLKCILSDKNLGYAKGFNLALKHTNNDFILTLTPDVIIDNKLISRLEKFLKKILVIGEV